MTLAEMLMVNGQSLAQATLTAGDFYEWQQIELTCQPQPQVVAATLRINDLDLGAPSTTLDDPLWRWRWNPQHSVGHFVVSLRLHYHNGKQQTEQHTLRIMPRKLDIERYEALLTAIQRDVFGVVYAISGGRQGAALQPKLGPRSLVEEYYALVEGHVAEALTLVKQIGSRPQQRLTGEQTETSLGEISRLDPQLLSEITRLPLDEVQDDVLPELQSMLRSPGQVSGGPLPSAIPTIRSAASFDVIEHRVLRQVLQVLLWRVGFVRDLARRELRRRRRVAELTDTGAMVSIVELWVQQCDVALRKLRHALEQPLLRDLHPASIAAPTHLMRRDPRYRRLYALYRSLRTTPFLAFDSPALWLPIAELPLLYEQWCVLQTVHSLLPLGELVSQQLLEQEDGSVEDQHRWTLRLRQGAPLLVLRLPDGRQLVLWYQRRYQPHSTNGNELGALDPFVRIPDIAIEVLQPDGARQVLVFDAKYRVAPGGGVPQDALDDAYAYRSAIGIDGARATLGSFLLFPGSKRFSTADNVGALPLLPNETAELLPLIQQIISHVDAG